MWAGIGRRRIDALGVATAADHVIAERGIRPALRSPTLRSLGEPEEVHPTACESRAEGQDRKHSSEHDSGLILPRSSRPVGQLPGVYAAVPMKAHTEYLTFHTKKRRELVHLTPTLEEILARAAIREGFMLVSAMHITAGVFVNDDESGLHADIWEWLEKLAPFREDYRHHRTGEDNGDAHLKSMLVHHEVIVPVTAGRLDLGPWQRVFYAEFDGQRDKRLIIKTMGE
jgi:secondary thiamine-phosphate synthase enzyme